MTSWETEAGPVETKLASLEGLATSAAFARALLGSKLCQRNSAAALSARGNHRL